MKPAQKAMIYKDVKEVLRNKMLLLPMTIVPLIFVFIFPIVIFATAGAGANSENLSDLEPLIALLGSAESFESDAQLIIHIVLNYIYPPFFLLIPIMTSSILGASSFVGERERKTLETLLYTPLSVKELFRSKVIATFVPAYIITFISFILFGIVANVGGWFYFEKLIFPNLKWLITILLLSPAVTVLGITFMVIVSAKVKTFQEAQQMSALVVLPIILLVVGQATGLFLLNETVMLVVGAAIVVADYFLLEIASKKFKPEELI